MVGNEYSLKRPPNNITAYFCYSLSQRLYSTEFDFIFASMEFLFLHFYVQGHETENYPDLKKF